MCHVSANILVELLKLRDAGPGVCVIWWTTRFEIIDGFEVMFRLACSSTTMKIASRNPGGLASGRSIQTTSTIHVHDGMFNPKWFFSGYFKWCNVQSKVKNMRNEIWINLHACLSPKILVLYIGHYSSYMLMFIGLLSVMSKQHVLLIYFTNSFCCSINDENTCSPEFKFQIIIRRSSLFYLHEWQTL